MKAGSYLDRLTESGEFRWEKLVIRGVDNTPLTNLLEAMVEGEVSLFHGEVSCGDEYVEIFHHFIEQAMVERRPGPVARFADGEYAFYRESLHCNGLYRQAESKAAIRRAMPFHRKALKTLSRKGKIAAVIYPGNIQRKKRRFPFFQKPKGDDGALKFLDFLSGSGIALTGNNFLPFFVVYAYLTSKRFSRLVDGRNICIVNSEFDGAACGRWFSRHSSNPHMAFSPIPDSYMATQWPAIREEVLASIPPETDICLVGAGVGALLICVDAAEHLSIPAIDAGHVLNMMNGMEAKSGGPRLYTIHKEVRIRADET